MGKHIVLTVTNDLQYDQRMRRICATLHQHGYQITLVGRFLSKSIQLSNQPYQQIRLKHLIFKKGKLFYLEFNLRLLLFLIYFPFDAICSIDLDTAIPGILVSKIKRKKHLFDAHELFTHVPEVARRKHIQMLWESVQSFTFKYTHAAYTVGPAIAQYFEEKYHKPVGVVRNMPLDSDAVLATNFTLPAGKFILYQGALNEGRGLENLISAMHHIPCDLVFAGEGNLSNLLRIQCQNENLDYKIHFLGMISPENLPTLTQKAYIGYNVSENLGLSYYLSLNNKFFDYAKALLPSLINPFPEYQQLLTEFRVGLLTEPQTTDIIIQANRLLHDEVLYLQIKTNCMSAADAWTWENETPALLEIYKNILGE